MKIKLFVLAAFIAGLFLNTVGTVPSAEAFTIPEETKQALSPIKSWYFTGRATVGRTSGNFVARVTFDSSAKDMLSSSRLSKFPIKEFVLTMKNIYIVSRSGDIKIYDNSLNGKDTIILSVGESVRGESTYQIKKLVLLSNLSRLEKRPLHQIHYQRQTTETHAGRTMESRDEAKV